MHEREVTLVVSLPIDGDEGEGTLQDLDFRHALEDQLTNILDEHQLGHVDGGGQGGGYQDVFMLIHREAWEEAWNLVKARLTELRILDRAIVTVSLDEGQPAQTLWPPSESHK